MQKNLIFYTKICRKNMKKAETFSAPALPQNPHTHTKQNYTIYYYI